MRSLTELDTDEIARLRERGEFFWLDLQDAEDTTIQQLGELFGYHRLALEDSREFGQRPKLDAYDDHVLIVWYGMDRMQPVEVHVYVSGDAVVTVHRGQCDVLADAHRVIDERHLKTEGAVVYRVLDTLTDSFYPVLDDLDVQIEGLEEHLFTLSADSEEQRQQIFGLRRRLVELRRIVVPQRDVFASGGEQIEQIPGLDASHAHDAFRDIHDHLLSIGDTIDAQRELLSEALSLYATAVSNRVNETSKQLTIISTIFLPLTFVTGFFGQNFGWLVDHIDSETTFLIWGGGALLVSVALIYLVIRRSGAFDTTD